MSNTFSEIAFHFPLSDFVGFVSSQLALFAQRKAPGQRSNLRTTESFCKQKTNYSFFLTVPTPIFLALSIISERLLAKFRESHFRFGLEHDSVIGAAARTLAATHSQSLMLLGRPSHRLPPVRHLHRQALSETGMHCRHAISPLLPLSGILKTICVWHTHFFWHALLISLVRWELNHSNWSLVVAV